MARKLCNKVRMVKIISILALLALVVKKTISVNNTLPTDTFIQITCFLNGISKGFVVSISWIILLYGIDLTPADL